MANTQLLIPQKIKVGFQKRTDTYSRMLAYVIYYDQTGKLRKEKSWQSWRDKAIEPEEFTNEPTEGFVLNKGVGGVRQSYGWDTRNEYVRVYDPRGFEFEISIPNLLFILDNSNAYKGKGLEGKFVYSWAGANLVLLPISSPEYKQCQEYTTLQTKKVSSKELILGATYVTKKQEPLVYLGRFDWHVLFPRHRSDLRNHNNTYLGYVGRSHMLPKQYIFQKSDGTFTPLSGLTTIAGAADENPVHDYAERLERFQKSRWGSPVVRLSGIPTEPLRTVPYDYNCRISTPRVFLATEGGFEIVGCQSRVVDGPDTPKLSDPDYYNNYNRDRRMQYSYHRTGSVVKADDRGLVVLEGFSSRGPMAEGPFYTLRLHLKSGAMFDYTEEGLKEVTDDDGSDNPGVDRESQSEESGD